MNTGQIIAKIGYTGNAAESCAKLNDGNYGDWYLPSIYELELLRTAGNSYPSLGVNVSASGGEYWSSNEDLSHSSNAYSLKFSPALPVKISASKMNSLLVRPIRAF
jgi:hypothetical protein